MLLNDSCIATEISSPDSGLVKLSICFPTFDRCSYLRRAIESVLSQIEGAPTTFEIEISVYDNASSDGTQDYGRNLASLNSCVRYFRNDENIGGDANIRQALNRADGDYIWIFGDDDYLMPGALQSICSILLGHRISLMKLSAMEERDCGGSLKSCAPPKLRKDIKAIQTSRFESADQVLATFGMGLGNFSSLIISREFYARFHKPPSPVLFRSGYSQLAWIYEGIFEQSSSFVFLNTSLLVVRIEMAPQGVSVDQIAAGLTVLEELLPKIGYRKENVANFLRKSRDAILVGKVKAKKIASQPVVAELFSSLFAVSSFSSRLKLVVIGMMPPRLYRRVWLSLAL